MLIFKGNFINASNNVFVFLRKYVETPKILTQNKKKSSTAGYVQWQI